MEILDFVYGYPSIKFGYHKNQGDIWITVIRIIDIQIKFGIAKNSKYIHILLPSSRYDWDTIERDVKLNIIHPSIWKSHDQRVKIHCISCSVNAFDLEVRTQCTLRRKSSIRVAVGDCSVTEHQRWCSPEHQCIPRSCVSLMDCGLVKPTT